ncbi:hypothetical protein Clacol_010143 [Clathrus columnatus]|uniref:Carboxypeptidase n=1 Tax=Clathrus columnatus TaxID=1419009 RepID=A0AAV5AVH6_9AGAM|nr:hypothetical protein Clacol_010143 [Clathrus columnatus]
MWKLFNAVLLAACCSNLYIHARQMSPSHLKARQQAVMDARRSASSRVTDRKTNSTGPQNITFTNPKASEFYVDGASIPEVTFDVGPSWAGLLPISSSPNETRKLPNIQHLSATLGLTAVPAGLLEENGPFSWSPGTAAPVVNEYSWTNLSSVLWIEQPTGVGFSQGEPNIKGEDDLAAQLVGFLQQFLEIFSELKGKNFYITGESYAGMYVPYIANYIYENPGTVDLNLKGIWIGDPTTSWNVVHTQIPALHFVKKYKNVFAFNSTYMDHLEKKSARCHYTDYFEKHVSYPPKGLLPLPGRSTESDPDCDIWDDIFEAALIINPAFNVYRIFDVLPVLWDVLGFPGSFPNIQSSPLYFDRMDVKEAIHAPVDVNWTECANINVFPQGDNSLPSSLSVLPNVIEKSERSVIVHGLADFVLIAEGTRIAIQNMTWNGKQGFQNPIQSESFLLDGVGSFGNMHSERGLAYVEVSLSGHMVPEYQPQAAFQLMQYLMGFRDSP